MIQLGVALIRRTHWITKAPSKICVLDDDSSSRRTRLSHRCETLLRLVQMGEQKAGISNIELFVPQACASIHLLKCNGGDLRRFGIFSSEAENLRVCVCAD